MTQREKILAICVGGALGGLGLVAIVKWGVVSPLVSVQQAITAEETKGESLENQLRALARVEKKWEALTAQTLADDPADAQLLFKENLHGLLERHGLSDDPQTKDMKISSGTISRDKNGFFRVPVTINTTGTLKEVVGFLRDFYRQGYVARLEKVTLNADPGVVAGLSSSRRGRSSPRPGAPRRSSAQDSPAAAIGPDGPELSVKMTATTLVLSPIKGIAPKPTEKPEEVPLGPLAAGDLVAYNEIFDKNLFELYRPPVPKPPVREQRTTPVATDTEPPPPPPPPPPLRPTNLYVRFTGTLNDEPITYVCDDSRRDTEPTPYRLDDDIDDGTLLLIHKHGLVVRVEEPNGRQTDYFYPLGDNFAARVELNEYDHPTVWAALQQEFLPLRRVESPQ